MHQFCTQSFLQSCTKYVNAISLAFSSTILSTSRQWAFACTSRWSATTLELHSYNSAVAFLRHLSSRFTRRNNGNKAYLILTWILVRAIFSLVMCASKKTFVTEEQSVCITVLIASIWWGLRHFIVAHSLMGPNDSYWTRSAKYFLPCKLPQTPFTL